MTVLRAASFAALLLLCSVLGAVAEDVTLTSRDGSVEIAGNLLSFDGEFYRVDTIYGVLTVDGSGVLCDGPGCPDLQAFVAEFEIAGSRTMGEVLVPALVEAFAARNGYAVQRSVISDTKFGYTLVETDSDRPAARIGFHVTSTDEGFADLLANEADLVLSTRPVTAQEIQLARDAGLGNLGDPRRSRIVGLDALVPVVASGNPADALSLETLAEIFAGEVDNWQAVGGEDAPILLHLRDDLSGAAREFLRQVLLPYNKTLAGSVARHANNLSLVEAVSRDPHALGIASFSELGNTRALEVAGACRKGTVASPVTIKTQDYPLVTPLFVYTPARRLSVLAREFLSYIRSGPAQPVVTRAGFVDLRLQQIPTLRQGDRISSAVLSAGEETKLPEVQRLVRRMQGTARLTLNFRFASGTELDAQSLSNVDILAREIEAGAFYGRKLIFVGFSDGEGDAAANLRLARTRARTVRNAVLTNAVTADRDRLTLSTDAFGEAMPLACDDSDWGRRINRRVEVWVDQM